MKEELERMPIDRLVRPFRDFAQHRLAGAILLMSATVAALVLANSPLAHDYHHLFETTVGFGAGSFPPVPDPSNPS